MKRVLLTALLLLLAACGASKPEAAITPAGELTILYDDVARPTVRLEVAGSYASGVVIAQDSERAMILTVAHAIPVDGTSILVHQEGREGVVAKVRHVDAERDLALLETSTGWPRVALSINVAEHAEVAWGVPVVVYGHPYNELQGVLTDGRVTALNSEGYLRISAPTYYGNSGGGIWLKSGGRWYLISIMQRFAPKYPVLSCGAPPDTLRAYLEAQHVR